MFCFSNVQSTRKNMKRCTFLFVLGILSIVAIELLFSTYDTSAISLARQDPKTGYDVNKNSRVHVLRNNTGILRSSLEVYTLPRVPVTISRDNASTFRIPEAFVQQVTSATITTPSLSSNTSLSISTTNVASVNETNVQTTYQRTLKPTTTTTEAKPTTRRPVAFTKQRVIFANKHWPTPKTEVRHIGFVKVHKAASSTLQNIFFRFGFNRNLSFVIADKTNYFSRNTDRHLPIIKPKFRNGYDILCNHGIFNHSMYSSFLPADSVYLAIIRNPLDVFISAVNFYTRPDMMIGYLRRVPGNRVQNLIRNTSQYDPLLFSYTRNVMTRDLGFPMSLVTADFDNYLQHLEKTLKLVLLVEYFDESLVLMKRYLNWKMEDIMYIANNVYGQGWSVDNLTPADIDLFSNRNSLDIKVYKYFYKRFWRQFNEEGAEIHSEVLQFKAILNKVKSFCNNKFNDVTTGEYLARIILIPASRWNAEILIDRDDCQYMQMKELIFLDYLRHYQGSVPEKVTTVTPPDVVVETNEDEEDEEEEEGETDEGDEEKDEQHDQEEATKQEEGQNGTNEVGVKQKRKVHEKEENEPKTLEQVHLEERMNELSLNQNVDEGKGEDENGANKEKDNLTNEDTIKSGLHVNNKLREDIGSQSLPEGVQQIIPNAPPKLENQIPRVVYDPERGFMEPDKDKLDNQSKNEPRRRLVPPQPVNNRT